MNLKELNDSWEKQYLGAEFTRRLQQRLIAEHSERVRRETERRIFESVVVSVLDQKRRVKGIGLSMPGDLILDNFGKWLSKLIVTPAAADVFVSLVDVGNTSRTLQLYSDSDAGKYYFNQAIGLAAGTRLRVGSGTTSPARGDYTIEEPFTTAPESGYFGSGSGSYANGVITFSSSITAGGSGIIRETGFFAHWHYYADNNIKHSYMLFHNLVSAVGFSAGQIITVAYTINL